MTDGNSALPLLGLSQRQPPANVPAEMALLGAMMANAKSFHAVADFLRPEHFAEPAHRRIYAEQARRILAGGIADALTLKVWWESDPDSSDLGGFRYLSQITESMVTIIAAKDYGGAIRDAWLRRELIAIGEDLVNSGFGTESAPESVYSDITTRLDETMRLGHSGRRTVSLDDAMDAAVTAAEEAHRRGAPTGISTGFPGVDAAIGGLEPATLTVLGGRPGSGKSGLGWQFAIHAARVAKAGVDAGGKTHGVLGISLEMSAEALARRALAAAAGVPVHDLKRGTTTSDDIWKVDRARQEMRGLPLSIEDGGGMTMGAIRLKVRQAQRRHGLSLIVIDHLHLVRPEDRDVRNGATYAVGQVATGLLDLAKEFDVPVLALAQLNRGVEGRDDKRPTKADLRQSGDIEQNADNILFLFRPEYYLPNSEPYQQVGEPTDRWRKRIAEWEDARRRCAGKAELIVAKQRDGAESVVPLEFDGPTASFRDHSDGHSEMRQ